MMRVFGFAASLLLLATSSSAMPGDTNLAPWQKYVPAGWKAIGSAQGKLNAKSSGDAVLVIEKDDPSLRIKNDNLGQEMLNLNPRKLLFLTKTQQSYLQVGFAEGFIPSEGSKDSPCLSDPLEEGNVEIIKGVVSITLRYWLSCGSYDVTSRTFKFRPENGKHRLIGVEAESFSRAGGGGVQVSAYYLTGKRKTTTGVVGIGPDAVDAKPIASKVTWSRLVPTIFYLENMKQSDCDEYNDAPSWCYL
jgi:hypothetical protein